MEAKMSKMFSLLVLVSILLTACGFQGFKQSDVIDMGGNIYVITIDGTDTAQRRHVPNPDTLDALGIPRSKVDNRGQSYTELEAIKIGADIPDVDRDYMGFVAFKDKYFPNTTPIKPGGVGQTETVVKGKLGVVRARTTSFEVKKGETVDIPVLVTSKTANLFEIWYPVGGHGTCQEYVDVYPGRGTMYVGSTIQLQLVGLDIGTCETTLNITLYVNSPTNTIIEELQIPTTITVTK
jgi:hypothetical protein